MTEELTAKIAYEAWHKIMSKNGYVYRLWNDLFDYEKQAWINVARQVSIYFNTGNS